MLMRNRSSQERIVFLTGTILPTWYLMSVSARSRFSSLASLKYLCRAMYIACLEFPPQNVTNFDKIYKQRLKKHTPQILEDRRCPCRSTQREHGRRKRHCIPHCTIITDSNQADESRQIHSFLFMQHAKKFFVMED